MLLIACLLFTLGVLFFNYSSLTVSTIAMAVVLGLFTFLGTTSHLLLAGCWLTTIAIFGFLNLKTLRRQLLTRTVFSIFRKVAPKISTTEQAALDAGDTGWEAEFFTGRPDWSKFDAISKPQLSKEEQDFLDGPTEELCRMIDAWSVTKHDQDIPKDVWHFIKENGFFGMIIPKSYGGKEFSAIGHSAVITKIAAKHVSIGTTVSVPNSLGPAELLLHYGTKDQKDYYLPRLAKGEEVPCFALTSPVAGSDAASLIDSGIVCKQEINGESVLGIKLNWNKRYITLAPKATVLGLAFKLFDPDHLLGGDESLGITLALVPVKTPGVTIGRRHYPLHSMFPNGPTQGKDVFITFDQLIGDKKYIGQGWKMLMQCLAAGRCISLPSMAAGPAKILPASVGAYARIRKQFGVSLSSFEGVQEALTSVITTAYKMEATRLFSVNNLDLGGKSAVASAICKYHITEMGRDSCLSAMDVLGGKAICMGPRNMIADTYTTLPVSITVEGANILTRSLIIFGQGAIRCHPYVLGEMKSVNDSFGVGLKKFDKLLFSHLGLIISNCIRSVTIGLTGGLLSRSAKSSTSLERKSYKKIMRYSACFAFLTDMSMVLLGSKLKRKESLSARLGDMLSNLYILTSCLKYFSHSKDKAEESPILEWVADSIFFDLEASITGIIDNLPLKFMRPVFRFICLPLGKRAKKPSDELLDKITKLFTNPTTVRDRILDNVSIAADTNNPMGFAIQSLEKVIAVEDLERKLYKAVKSGQVTGLSLEEQLRSATATGLLTEQQAQNLIEVDKIRTEVCAVDDFSDAQLHKSNYVETELEESAHG